MLSRSNFLITSIRHKHKPTHWSVLRKKIFPKHKAMEHFDDFYKQVFQKSWPSIRQGLLGKPKYIAVVNNYADSDETITELENLGALNMRRLFNLEKGYVKEKIEKNIRQRSLERIWQMDKDTEVISEDNGDETVRTETKISYSLESDLRQADYDISRIVDTKNILTASVMHHFVPATKIKGKEDFITESSHYAYYDDDGNFKVRVVKEYDISFPEQLNIYCFEHSNHTDFKSPKKGTTGVLNYYLMNGGSLFPVLALDIQPGVKVLDMCAAPGGKSLLVLQTLRPNCIVCNDNTYSRVDRLYNVLRQYLFDLDERWLKPNKIKVTCLDGLSITEDNFDRILVDVPCTTDRHSVIENDNNMFKSTRIKERLQLPEKQCELLVQALKLVKKGGIVVYSTCSLSPIQNDGVVHMALKQLWEETHIDVIVKDLSPALIQAQNVFRLADKSIMKYGHLVVPYLPQNYGPTYFCKLQRIS